MKNSNRDANFKEKLKQALASTVRVISDDFENNSKQKKEGNLSKIDFFNLDNLVTKNASMAKYQIKNTSKNYKTQYQMLKKLEINKNFHLSLINECNKKKIKFIISHCLMNLFFYIETKKIA